MRPRLKLASFVALLSIALATQAAEGPPRCARAADGVPTYAKDSPYDRVRVDLIRHGFQPVRILKHPEGSGVYCHVEPEACRRYPERYVCAMTACRILFERLSDGALFSLAALGESAGPYHFVALEPLDTYDLEDLRAEYVIARPVPQALRRSP